MRIVFLCIRNTEMYNNIEVNTVEKKFIITPKTERSVTVTVRIEKESHDRLEELVIKSGRSRNELINKAIKFALDNLEFAEEE